MKLYQLVDASQLDNSQFYTVHGVYSRGYLCGQFGYKTVDDNSVHLTFFAPLFVNYKKETLIPVTSIDFHFGVSGRTNLKYLGLSDTKVFKRVIYEEEQRGTYRRAFQKRAVQQIVSYFLEICSENTSSLLFSSLVLAFL